VRKYVFADESGCMTFRRDGGASRFFIVCTITCTTCDIANALLSLRRKLAWDRQPLGDFFHATTDAQSVRNEVFAEILKHDFQVQATIMEKSKAQPQVRSSREIFYKYGWHYHFQHALAKYVVSSDELHIVAASIGTKKGQKVFTSSVNDVVRQHLRLQRAQWTTDFCPAATDPCLQVADYCSWAIQRRWEMGDHRSYDLIKSRINYEYDLWQRGTLHYY
jgi:Protein of unknown function (DUF3800)